VSAVVFAALAAETHRAGRSTLFAFGALSLLAAASVFAIPGLFDAGARFRYRLLHRDGEGEERAVRRDRVYRKLLAAVFVVAGVLEIAKGISAS
jgi:hypothetical protein